MYRSLHAMKRITIYLPEELKAGLERIAQEAGRSEADLIRHAIADAVERHTPPAPRVPLTSDGLGDPTAAERVDELLAGFG